MSKAAPKRNILRRLAGILLCSLPLVLAIACAISQTPLSPPRRYLALVLVTVACLVGILNSHLNYVRPWLYQRKHQTMVGFRFISGLPIIGTFLQIAGCIVGFGSPTVGILGLAAGLIDTGGLPWIPVVTWKDSSLWDQSLRPATKPEQGTEPQYESRGGDQQRH